MIPEKVAEFRARFRDEYISPRYSGVAHFAVHVDGVARRRRLVRSDGARAAPVGAR